MNKKSNISCASFHSNGGEKDTIFAFSCKILGGVGDGFVFPTPSNVSPGTRLYSSETPLPLAENGKFLGGKKLLLTPSKLCYQHATASASQRIISVDVWVKSPAVRKNHKLKREKVKLIFHEMHSSVVRIVRFESQAGEKIF